MTIEDVERYWSSRPCNVKHSPLDIDVDPLGYSQGVTWRKRFVEPHTMWFSKWWRWAGKRVLEMGCGIGTDTLTFAKAGAEVAAVDISKESIGVAARRASAEGMDLSNLIWVVANIEESFCGPDVANNFEHFGSSENAIKWWTSFDLVYSFGVIHHTPHPWRAVQNAYSSLKPGGEFRLMLYHRKSTKVLRILMRHLGDLCFRRKSVDQIVALESEAQSGCPVTYTYTKKTAKELLESCGFQIEKMEVEHIFPYNVGAYKKYIYRRGFPWNVCPYRLFRWLEKHVGWHLLIVARKLEADL